jgi:hypothetical protein
MTIEAICNQALDIIGYPRHIGNIYEGTKASREMLNAWVETRDALIEKLAPDWARRDVILTLMKSAPNIVNGSANYTTGWNDTYPPLPWLYEYQYPTDCLVPLQIKEAPLFLPIWRPRFNTMRLTYEVSGMKRTILSNVPGAILIYVATVSDPDDWQKDFTELMIMALAKKVEAGLMPQQAARRRQQEQQQEQQDGGNSAG